MPTVLDSVDLTHANQVLPVVCRRQSQFDCLMDGKARLFAEDEYEGRGEPCLQRFSVYGWAKRRGVRVKTIKVYKPAGFVAQVIAVAE